MGSSELSYGFYSGGLHGDGQRHVLLEDFHALESFDATDADAYRRRYASLFLDDGSARKGGSGCVYHGRNAWGDDLAVKVIESGGVVAAEDGVAACADAAKAADALQSAIFKREYEAQRMLSGVRGFPTLYGWGRLDGQPAIVMEWLTGETLEHARQQLAIDDRGAIPPHTAAALGRDIFDLIARMELFDAGLVHRDLSPANIMIATNEKSVLEQAQEGAFELRLIDFGSSVLPRRAPSLTEVGGALRGATPDFAPPEMLTEDVPGVVALRKSSAVDVYAAASIVYLLLSGQAPYDLKAAALAPEGTSSYYLKKTQELPRVLEDAHRAATDLPSILERERAVDGTLAAALEGAGPDADDAQLRKALRVVDGQIAEVVLACLEPAQELRPTAASVRDALGGIAATYAQDAASALRGEEVAPSRSLQNVLARERRDAARSARGYKHEHAGRFGALDTVVRVAAVVILAATMVVVGASCDGAAATFALGPLSWSGLLSGWVVGIALAVPAAVGYCLRWRDGARTAGFLRGTIGIAAATVLLCIAFASLRFEMASMGNLLLWAVVLCAAIAWVPMVLDFTGSLRDSSSPGASKRAALGE